VLSKEFCYKMVYYTIKSIIRIRIGMLEQTRMDFTEGNLAVKELK